MFILFAILLITKSVVCVKKELLHGIMTKHCLVMISCWSCDLCSVVHNSHLSLDFLENKHVKL